MKFRGKRRNTVESYQGKYKKMNSGKYLYKLESAAPPQTQSISLDKKSSMLSKKRKLRYFDSSVVDTIKNFILKLNKIDEERKTLKKRKKLDNQSNFPNQISGQAGNYSFDEKFRSKADDPNAREQQSKKFNILLLFNNINRTIIQTN